MQKMNRNNINDTTIKCYCNKCDRQTNHLVTAEDRNTYRDDVDGVVVEEIFRLVKCRGCDNVSFNRETTGSEYIRYGEFNEEEMYSDFDAYPIKEGTLKPLESWDVPVTIRRVYRESITAFNEECYVLATTGLRTTVEAICKDKGISGNLKNMIDGLRSQGIITDADCKRLHQMRFSGNESVHEMQPLEKNELLLLIDIINNVLNNLYVLDKKFKDTFFYRFESLADFFTLLDAGLRHYSIGSSYTLHGLMPDEYKYRKEDILRYEQDVIAKVRDGSYVKLQLDGTPSPGQRQRFKILCY